MSNSFFCKEVEFEFEVEVDRRKSALTNFDLILNLNFDANRGLFVKIWWKRLHFAASI